MRKLMTTMMIIATMAVANVRAATTFDWYHPMSFNHYIAVLVGDPQYVSGIHFFIMAYDDAGDVQTALGNEMFSTSMPQFLHAEMLTTPYPAPLFAGIPTDTFPLSGGAAMLVMWELTPDGKEHHGTTDDYYWEFFGVADATSMYGGNAYLIDEFGKFDSGYYSFPIPEPATGLLALAGVAMFIAQRRRKS